MCSEDFRAYSIHLCLSLEVVTERFPTETDVLQQDFPLPIFSALVVQTSEEHV